MTRTVLVALAFLAAACGSDPCEDFGNLVCERACDCADGDECRFATGGGTATVTFDSESDCKGFYRLLVCGDDQDPVVDVEACSAAVEVASCIATAEGMALSFPEDPACEDTQ